MALSVAPTPNDPTDVCFHSVRPSSHFGPLETSVMNFQTSSTERSITTLASTFVMPLSQTWVGWYTSCLGFDVAILVGWTLPQVMMCHGSESKAK